MVKESLPEKCDSVTVAPRGASLERWPMRPMLLLNVFSPAAVERILEKSGYLAWLRERRPSLEVLCARHGRAWVEFHVLRLFLLGLISLRGS